MRGRATRWRSCCTKGRSVRGWSRPGSEMSDIKFEDALHRLEQIVDRLEAGNLPLEESLKVFEEGVGLARRCARYLEDAEKRIELLTRDENGLLRTEPLILEEEGG